MGELEAPEREQLEYFSTSARSGRRNALPEIEIEVHDPDAAKLADRLSDMTARCDTERVEQQQQSTSQHQQQGNS